jgi:hypothetical protein
MVYLLISQIIGIAFNLRSFILIQIAWQAGIDSVVKSGDGDWSQALPFFIPFVVFNIIWVIAFLSKNGIMFYRIDQLGFHLNLVNAKKTVLYKRFCYGAAFLIVVLALTGMAMHPDVAQAILSMISTIAIALFDLYSPLEETVIYTNKDDDGFDIHHTPIRGQILAFTDSNKIVEMFQDGVLSAMKGDFSHLRTLTELPDDDIKRIIKDVHSVPRQETPMMNCFGCSNVSPTSPSHGGGDDLEMAASTPASPV